MEKLKNGIVCVLGVMSSGDSLILDPRRCITIVWGWGMIMGWTVALYFFIFSEMQCAIKCMWLLIIKEIYTTLFNVIADSSHLQLIEGAHLDCGIKKHPALESVMHLLPENVLVSGDESIPGLAASATGKPHVRNE